MSSLPEKVDIYFTLSVDVLYLHFDRYVDQFILIAGPKTAAIGNRDGERLTVGERLCATQGG